MISKSCFWEANDLLCPLLLVSPIVPREATGGFQQVSLFIPDFIIRGEAIPVSARLMALVDVYDAIISRRVYKDPLPHARAVEIIREESGRQFDPAVVSAFLAIEGKFSDIAKTYRDELTGQYP